VITSRDCGRTGPPDQSLDWRTTFWRRTAPATRAMFGDLTMPELVGAILDHEELVEPAAACRRRLLEELALRLAMNPRGGPLFQARADLEQLSATERDLLMKGAAQALERWWKTPAGVAERRRQVARISEPPWF
jgi:hypothetical protein